MRASRSAAAKPKSACETPYCHVNTARTEKQAGYGMRQGLRMTCEAVYGTGYGTSGNPASAMEISSAGYSKFSSLPAW